MTNPRRRQAGEGGISEYVTKAGPRYLIKYGYIREDGSRAVALKRLGVLPSMRQIPISTGMGWSPLVGPCGSAGF